MELSLLRKNYLFPKENNFQHHECYFPPKKFNTQSGDKTSHQVMR